LRLDPGLAIAWKRAISSIWNLRISAGPSGKSSVPAVRTNFFASSEASTFFIASASFAVMGSGVSERT
jgi:hypothetical protein